MREATLGYPAQIAMGHGLVDVTGIYPADGRVGLLLRPREAFIPVGEPGTLGNEGQPSTCQPVASDVVIWLDGPEMGRTIIDKLLEMAAIRARATDGGEARVMAFLPITTVEEFDALDTNECVAGYYSARAGHGEPGGNHSRSYWHGWRCGMMDAGTLPIPPEHRALLHQLVRRAPTPSAGVPGWRNDG